MRHGITGTQMVHALPEVSEAMDFMVETFPFGRCKESWVVTQSEFGTLALQFRKSFVFHSPATLTDGGGYSMKEVCMVNVWAGTDLRSHKTSKTGCNGASSKACLPQPDGLTVVTKSEWGDTVEWGFLGPNSNST